MVSNVTIGAPRPAPSFTPVFVAIDRQLLAAEGLTATIKYRAHATDLVSGEVDFLASGHGHVEFVKGSDIRIVCGHSTRGGAHVLVVRPEIDHVKNLKHVLVAAEENVFELRNILAHYGVDLDSSGIKLTMIDGSHPKQFEALQRGEGDGATLGAPWWMYAVKEGYKNVGSGDEFGHGLPGSGIYVAAKKIKENPDQVSRFVKAYVKTIKYCKENIPETLQTIMKYSADWGVNNLEVAKMAYDSAAPYWNPSVDPTAIDRLLKVTSEKLGKPPVAAEKFLELRFLQAALQETA